MGNTKNCLLIKYKDQLKNQTYLREKTRIFSKLNFNKGFSFDILLLLLILEFIIAAGQNSKHCNSNIIPEI